MRNYILIWISLCLFSCHQKTDKQKAEAIVRDYMKDNLHDFNSYEVVETVLTADSTGFYGTPPAKRLRDSSLANEIISVILEDSVEKTLKKKYFDSLYEEASQKFHKEFIGWNIYQKFRAKNGFGALQLHEMSFTCNKNFDSLKVEISDDDFQKFREK